MRRSMRTIRLFAFLNLAVATTMAFAEADNATSPGSYKPPGELTEVVVTAQKRAENIQSVPVSITAISQNELIERNIHSLDDMAEIAPSLTVQKSANGYTNIVMRGLGASSVPSDKPTESASVGIYFDDVPVALALRSPDLHPVDLARVEVLRGPQGTLYGGGALGGAIKYVGNTPDYRLTGFGIEADVSNTRHAGFGDDVSATVNWPIVDDRLALRVVGYTASDPGFVRNVMTGLDKAGGTSLRGVRAQLGFHPTDSVELIAKFISQNSSYGPGASFVQRDVPFLPANTLQGLEQALPTDGYGYDHFKLYNLTATFDLQFAELYSATSRIDRQTSSVNDVSYLLGPGLTFQAVENVPDWETLEEIRLTSKGEGPWRWVIGGFYEDSHREYNADGPSPGFSAITGIDLSPYGIPEPDNLFRARNNVAEKQYALFGESSYDIAKLRFTAGVRLFKQTQTYNLTTTGLFSGGLLNGVTKADARGANPRFIISYRQSEDVLLSAQASKGFRLGGANDTIPLAFCGADLAAIGLPNGPRSYGPENVWSYELNAKTRFNNGRVTFNTALYQTRFKNVQLVQTLLNCGYNFVTNGASASTKGVEIDFAYLVTDAFSLRGGMSYTDAKLTSDVPVGVAGRDGDRLPLTPEWTANVVARYEYPFVNWSGFGQVDVRYQSNIVQDLASTVDPVPGRAEAGLRIGGRKGNLEISLYADNLFDSGKFTSARFIPAQGLTYTILRPRQIGLTMSLRQ